MAEEADDFEARADAVDRLRQVSRGRNEHDRPNDPRRQPRRKLSKSQRKRGARRKRKP
jgi:hypothetical protein